MKNIQLKIKQIILELVPVVVMILFIPIIQNDYVLLLVYGIMITGLFLIKYVKLDWLFFTFALIAMTASETLFVSTGVEVFKRNSLFGLMPIWLPVLWAYAFVVMRRVVKILEN